MRISNFPIWADVKQEYVQLRHDGIRRDEATQKLILKYKDELTRGEEDDGILFWIGLADAQYALHELEEQTIKKALIALDMIASGDWNITSGDIQRRRKWYASGPMPEYIAKRRTKKFRCSWKIGDTFAYTIPGNEVATSGYSGKTILFRKVDEVELWDHRVLPIVTASLWDEPTLPKCTEDFERALLLKLAKSRDSDVPPRYVYRVELLFRNVQQLNKIPLIYVGNFPDISLPFDEKVITYEGYMEKLPLERIEINCCYFIRNHDYFSEENC